MLFFGGLTAVLCVFALGLLWPHRTTLNLSDAIWGYFVKALYLAWVWFLVSFNTPAGDFARFVAVALTLAAIAQLVRGAIPAISLASGSLRTQLVRTALCLSAFLLLAYPAIFSFGTIFSIWDAVVSWNRWADEFTRNVYAPLPGAYPVLWPAIWSLIYEAQGNSSLWYVPKATIAIPLAGLAVLIADRIRGPQYISGSLLAAMTFLGITALSDQVVSGYMDLPLSIMGLGALLLLFSAVDEPDQARRSELFLLAVITSAVAMVTKQGGVAFAGIVGLAALYELLRGRMKFSTLILYGALVFFPIATYLQMYFSVTDLTLDSFDHLNQISDKARGESGRLSHAAGLLQEAFPVAVWPLIGLGAALNLIFFRSYKGVLGLLCLVAGGATFLLFSSCCAYNARNGYIVVAFGIASSYVGFSRAEAWFATRLNAGIFKQLGSVTIPVRTPLLISAAAMIAALAALTLRWPEERLTLYDEAYRPSQLGYGFPNQFLVQNTAIVDRASLLVSAYAIAGYLPLTEDKYFMCHRTDAACFARVRLATDADTVVVYSLDNFENDQSREFIKQAVASGRAKKLAGAGYVALYEFKVQ